MRVGVMGGGSFGHGLAVAAHRNGHHVTLWSRRTTVVNADVRTTQSEADLADSDVVFLAIPSEHVRAIAERVGTFLDGRHYLVHVSRGLVGDDLETLTRVLRDATPCRRVGALAGPLVADALENGRPSGAIVGTWFPEVADAVRSALAGPNMRVEHTEDVIGVEIASAMVGLFALGAGYLLGLHAEPAALSVYLTRGMEEATRLGTTLGADTRTFAGLAGFGDLISAVAGDARPEVRLGQALAQGEDLRTAAERTGAYIEGVSIASRVAAYGRRRALRTPISGLLDDLVAGRMRPSEAVAGLALGGTSSRQ